MHDNIQQLVYTSYATDHCGSDHIREIAHKATAFNKTVGLTGVLLVSGDRFIQLLESPERPLFDLYDRIKQDPRHTAVQTQWQGSAEERLMPTWSMGYLYLNAPDQNTDTLYTRFLNKVARECQSSGKQVKVLNVLQAFIEVFGDELDQQSFLAFVSPKRPEAASSTLKQLGDGQTKTCL